MESRDLTFSWEAVQLAGTLHLPDRNGQHPVVIMLQGSGSSDRDSNGYFVQIRERFLSDGLATFSFDKPGCGDSTGDWRDYALEERASQAEAALDVVARQSDVDPKRVGFWGQSQGGWLVQILASRHPDLPFAVANSGPSIGVVAQDRYGCRHTMEAAGMSEAHIEMALAFMKQGHEAAAAGMPYEQVKREFIDGVVNEPWYMYTPVEDAKDWESIRNFVTEGYDPHDALSRITCPFLAIYGGRDVLVPAWDSAQETGDCLVAAGARDVTVVVFPQGDHRIQDETTGEFIDGYLDLLGSWLRRRAGVGGP